MRTTSMRHRSATVAALLAAGVLATACGSGSGTPAATTTVPATVTSFSTPGPYAAGTTLVTMPDGDRVQLFYPVDRSAVTGKPTYIYSLKSWVPAAIANNPILSKLPNTVPTSSYLNAPISKVTTRAGGSAHGYPVVLFAHGFGSYPEQSTFLTDHLATWGFVVAAPDEQATDLTSVLSGTKDPSAITAGAALDATLAYLHTQQTASGTLLHGLLDLAELGVVGHSLGGGAAITMAGNPAVKTYVALAPAPGTPPTTSKPGLVMYGSADTVVPPSSVQQTYAALPTPKRLIVIHGAGHNVFDDICTIHSGTTRLVTILKATAGAPGGFGTLSTLATDGCFAPDVDPTAAFPLIDQAVTAQLRGGLGLSPAGSGFGPRIGTSFPGVTATSSATVGVPAKG